MGSSFKNPVETTKLIVAIVKSKNSTTISNLILLSFLVGVYITFCGLLTVVASAGMLDAGISIGLEKFVFSVVFPVGLIMVVLAGSELFTRNIMFMAFGVLDEKTTGIGLAKNWILS